MAPSAYARPDPVPADMGADTVSAEFGGPQVQPAEPRVSVLQDQPMEAPDPARRLSMGAGPISQQTAARAEQLVDGQDPGAANRPVVERAARGLRAQVDAGARTTFGDVVDRANDPTTVRMARQQKADEFRSIGEWAMDSSTALASGAVSLTQMVPNIVAPDSALSASLAKAQQGLQDMESAPMQARRQQLAERVRSEDGFLNQYLATVSELVTNPSVAIQESLRQAAMFAGVLGAAKLGGAAAGGAVGVAERASPTVALAEAISGGAVRTAAQAAGQTAGGVTAASTMAAGDAAGATYEKLMAADDGVWAKNPDFAEMVASGVPPEQAKQEIATSKARLAALIAAPLGLLGFMGAEASFARGAGGSTGRPLRTLATEMVTEPTEEALTTMAGNTAVQTVNPDQAITEGAGEAAGMATVTSGPFGAAAAMNEMRGARPPVDRTEQIKALRAAGDKTAADLLQRRQDRETAAWTTERETEALQTFGPAVQQRYRESRAAGAMPGDAVTQTAMRTTFEQAADAAGLSEKAREAALAKAATMPPDKAPGFLQKALQVFTSKGLAQPIEGADALATAIESRRDELLDAVLAADIRPTMAAIEELEQGATVAQTAPPDAENPVSDAENPQVDAQNPEIVSREADDFGGNDVLVTPETDAVHQAATSPLNDRPEPTQAQKEAGNYKLGRVRIGGMDIAVENPQGSVRRGTAPDGTAWETPMRDHYGYFNGTTAADGDKLDVFIKPGTAPDFGGTVFVVDQVDPDTGKFDEAKVIFGATDQADAEAIYARNYRPDWQGLGAITALPMPAFKAWATSPHTRKPLGVLPTRTNAEVAPPQPTTREAAPDQAPPAAGSDVAQPTAGVPAAGDAAAVEADGVVDAPGLASPDEQRRAAAELEQKRREKRARLTSNAWGQNPFRAFLGKHGISSALANEFAPGAAERRKAMVPGYGPIFRKAGKNIDMLAEAAREEGFIQGEDTAELYDLIARVFRGEKVIPVFAEGAAEQEMESRQAALEEDARAQFEDYADADPFAPDDQALLEEVGYDAADAAVQAEFRALIAAAEAEGIDTETLLEDAHYAAREDSDDQYRQRATADIENARSQRRETAGRARAEQGREAAEPAGREDGQQVPGPQGSSRPEVTTTLRADGTLAVKGDAPTIRKLLADAGITNVLPMRGGVLVGKSSVKQAQALFDEPVLTAPTRADVEAQQDRAEKATRDAAKKEADSKAEDARERERREVARRSEAAADTFELGQDPMANLTGQADIFAAAPPEVPMAATKNPPAVDRLTDAGEELTRNRRGKLKGLAWADVSDMNDTLKVSQVVKANVWPRPDYAKMVEEGAPAWKAAAFKAVYDKLAAAPVTRAAPTDADLRAYIETMHSIRDALTAELDRAAAAPGGEKTWQSLKAENVFGKVFVVPADARPMFGKPSPFDRSSEKGKENNKRALMIGGNSAVGALQFDSRVLSKIKSLVLEGFPAKQEAWQKSWEVRATETRNDDIPEAERTGEPQQRFYVYEKGSRWRLAKGGQDGGYATEEQAAAYARSLTARKKEMLPPSRGLDLADANRIGPDWRNGKDVTAQEIIDRFGFRGVNLGEYVKAKQGIAQVHLNHVYDAFSDLADVLGVPPTAMSLNGELGVAIGAQGSGKALAHFVPGVNEINITRDSGAGALAHEFGHALDHYFAAQHGRAASVSKRPYLSAVVGDMRDTGGVRPEVMEAMRVVMKTINTRSMTEAEARKYMEDQRTRNERYLDGWVKEFSGNRGADVDALKAVAAKLKRGEVGEPNGNNVETNIAEFIRAAGLKPGNSTTTNAVMISYRLRDLADEANFLKNHIPQVDTNYAKASSAMDAKKSGDGYWGTPWEKFARAFETFVMDALKTRQRESLYLSGLVDSDGWRDWAESTGKSIPYPEGAERLQMQLAFQKLVDTIETRETDTGVAMYARVLDADLFRRMTTPMQRGMPVADVERAIAPVLERWKSGPRVTVVATVKDLPVQAPHDVAAFYTDGRAYLVAANLKDRDSALRFLGHEVIAHHGLRELLGDTGFRQFTSQVQLALKSGNKPLAAIQAEVRKAYVDAAGKFNLTPHQESDEIAAKVVEQAIDAEGNFRPGFGFVKAVYARIVEFLRGLGLTVRFTHAELQGMLVNAQRGLEAGKRTAGARAAPEPVWARSEAVTIPAAVVGANLGAATGHPKYAAAKAGDIEAALEVARTLVTPQLVDQVRQAIGTSKPMVVPVVSIEAGGRNKIPLAAGELLAQQLGLATSTDIVQANSPKRTAMDGLDRIFAAPEFDGPVVPGQDYLILDDTLTQGATFAALAAHIEAGGGRVVSAVALTGKQYSAKIQPSADTLKALRDKHGDLEADFQAATGYGFGALTESEARYLANFKPAEQVRARIVEEGRRGVQRQDQGPVGGLTDDQAFARDATVKSPAAVEAEAAIDRQNPPTAGQPDLFTPGFWETPQDTRTDKFIFEVQDGRIDLKRVQQAITKVGGQIREQFDARLAETLYPGRVAHRAQQFLEDEAKPLLEVMARNNVPMAELSDYLHARGAEERNAQIAKVNPDLPDGGAGRNSKGVLLTNAAARQYLAAVTPARKMVLDALAKRVDAITSGTRRLLVDEGLEKAETIEAWEKAYQNYVPMFRDEAEEGRPHPTGSGMSVRGSASKRATGSTKEVTNILAHVLMQREAAITRAEKNRVAVALYGMALTNPNPDFWTTIRPGMAPAAIGRELQRMGVDPTVAEAGMQGVPTIRTVDPVLGRVVDRPNPIYKSLPGAIVLKVNGEDRVLMINASDPRGMRMAENLKNLDGLTRLDIASSAVGKTTRWLASVNTQYNPAFGLVNLTRDTLGGAINLSSTRLRGKTTKVLALTPGALRGIALELSGRPSGDWGKLWRQFQADGGQTGYREMFKDANDRTDRLQAELKSLEKAGKLTSQKVAGAVLGALDIFNTSLENAVRLAAYKEALVEGMSRAEAARLGRELTVDFNRKGRTGRELSPLYAFFNAAVQGSARTLETLAGPAGAKIIAGGLSLGVMQALMLLLGGYDDDEIPEFVKSRALIVPLGKDAEGKKQYFTIPYPLGLHVLPNTGRVLAELTLSGGEDAAARSLEAVGEIASAFNPLGGGNIFTPDGALRTIAPSVIDPIVELGANKNFAGAPIERESQGENDPRPGFQRAREATLRTATGQTYTDIARIINTMTGGNAYEKGLASPTPERVRYLAQVVGGGLLREIEKTVNTSIDAAKGQPVKASGVPVLGRFYGEVDDANVQRSRYFDNLREIETLERKIKAADKAGDVEAATRMEADGAVVDAARAARRAKKDIRDLNTEAMETIGDGAALRTIDEERTAVMKDLNEEVEAIRQETRGPTPGDRLRRAAGVAPP